MVDTCANDVSCIYLVQVGVVGDVRNTFNIPADKWDNSLKVYKFGCTSNYSDRMTSLNGEYGKLANVSIVPVLFHTIDPKYKFEAEGDLRAFYDMLGKKLVVDGYNELVVLNDMELKQMKSQYQMIGGKYAGITAGLNTRIHKLETELQLSEMRCQMLMEHLHGLFYAIFVYVYICIRVYKYSQ